MKGKPRPFPPLGVLDICLDVEDFSASRLFYEGLGFDWEYGEPEERWGIVIRDGVRIGLYEGHGSGNALNFRKGQIAHLSKAMEGLGHALENHHALEDPRCGSFTVKDPDGNALFFDTAPSEMESEA